MIAFPHAKINLGLHVTSKRLDGYHELETVLYPIHWCDALEVVANSQFSARHSGEHNWSIEDDICLKAMNLLRDRFAIPPTKLFLHKAIPDAAGLGGGSSDGAHTLKLINELHNLRLPPRQLQSLAEELGADCPFFLQQRPMLATGIGTELSAIEVDLAERHLVVCVPEVRISTTWAYKHVAAAPPGMPLREAISQPTSSWHECLVNDFENLVFKAHPELAGLKTQLYEAGAVYASLSGSGSAVYGLFNALPDTSEFQGVTLHTEMLT